MASPNMPRRRPREHRTGPQAPEQAPNGYSDRHTSPEPSTGRTCDHHADTLDAIATARQLAGADAGTVEALTAIAHAILATHKEDPR